MSSGRKFIIEYVFNWEATIDLFASFAAAAATAEISE